MTTAKCCVFRIFVFKSGLFITIKPGSSRKQQLTTNSSCSLCVGLCWCHELCAGDNCSHGITIGPDTWSYIVEHLVSYVCHDFCERGLLTGLYIC